MHDRIRAPRPPAFRQLQQRTSALARRAGDNQILRQERIGISERAHGDVLGRPRPYAGDGSQRITRGGRIGVATEVEPAACDCARQRAKRRSTLSGETETLERSLRQNVRGREHTPLPLADFDPPSESVSHSTQERPGASHRGLLSDDGADGNFEAVPAARHSQPGLPPDAGGQARIPTEDGRDDSGIRVQIEHVGHAREHAIEHSRILRRHEHVETAMLGIVADLEHPHGSCQVERARVRVAVGPLDPVDCAGSQESVHGGPVVWRPVRETETVRRRFG